LERKIEFAHVRPILSTLRRKDLRRRRAKLPFPKIKKPRAPDVIGKSPPPQRVQNDHAYSSKLPKCVREFPQETRSEMEKRWNTGVHRALMFGNEKFPKGSAK
jgi:hypothetical protein